MSCGNRDEFTRRHRGAQCLQSVGGSVAFFVVQLESQLNNCEFRTTLMEFVMENFRFSFSLESFFLPRTNSFQITLSKWGHIVSMKDSNSLGGI